MSGIEVKNLTKRYKEVCALDNVSLKFEENKIYGLLGRNGAGKSTLLNVISNRIFADSGEVLIDGEAAKENDHALSKVYTMSEHNYYPDKTKIKEIFGYTKHFYPQFDMAYAQETAEQFELNLNKTVQALSTGFHSIFKLIIALSVNTPYVLLDEPVLGLDANNRDLFYRLLLEKYSRNPSTIVISTHLIEEVSSVIEDIIIIKKGKIIRNESRDELLSKGYAVSGTAGMVDAFCTGKKVIGTEALGGLKTVYIIGEPQGIMPEGLEVSGIDLQKLFIQLTNS